MLPEQDHFGILLFHLCLFCYTCSSTVFMQSWDPVSFTTLHTVAPFVQIRTTQEDVCGFRARAATPVLRSRLRCWCPATLTAAFLDSRHSGTQRRVRGWSQSMCKWLVLGFTSLDFLVHGANVAFRLILLSYALLQTTMLSASAQITVPTWVCLCFCFFRSQTESFLKWPKKSLFDHNVRKGGLVNTVTASFNAVTGQMVEMSQRKKTVFHYRWFARMR